MERKRRRVSRKSEWENELSEKVGRVNGVSEWDERVKLVCRKRESGKSEGVS